MKETTISVIIVSYRSEDVIDDCIRSVVDNNDIGERLEVIIAEQSPEDGLYHSLRERYPDITVIRTENRGFGAGNNAAVREAQGDILFFLNPDTVIRTPLFQFLAERFEAEERLGLAGVRLESPEGQNISWDMNFPFGLAAKLKFVALRKADLFLSGQMYIGGADLIVRRSAFREAGGFDEALFMYGEEMDLCRRIRQAGYRVRYFREKRILHLQGQCTDDRYPAVFGKQLDSFRYVCRKHGIDAGKWLRKEARYQRFRGRIMRCMGRKQAAELAVELAEIARSRAGEE